jgi:hypothetical protein
VADVRIDAPARGARDRIVGTEGGAMKRRKYTAAENRYFLDALRCVLGLEPMPIGSETHRRADVFKQYNRRIETYFQKHPADRAA